MREVHTSFLSAVQGASIAHCQSHSAQFFGKDWAAAPNLPVMQPLFCQESRSWVCEKSRGFKSLGFSQMDPRWLGWNRARYRG